MHVMHHIMTLGDNHPRGFEIGMARLEQGTVNGQSSLNLDWHVFGNVTHTCSLTFRFGPSRLNDLANKYRAVFNVHASRHPTCLAWTAHFRP